MIQITRNPLNPDLYHDAQGNTYTLSNPEPSGAMGRIEVEVDGWHGPLAYFCPFAVRVGDSVRVPFGPSNALRYAEVTQLGADWAGDVKTVEAVL